MVKQQEALDRAFAALSDPTRRAIIIRLSRGDASVGDLAQPFAMSLPAISKHVRVLEGAGLISRRREGRTQRCTLVPERMARAAAWIEQNRLAWERRFDRLAVHLQEDQR